MQTQQVDVLIIGGGLTGLTLAYHLKNINVSFKIIEARNTIGGRINTKYNTNQAPIELGATWLIQQQTTVLALLKTLGISVFEQHYGKTAIYQPNKTQAAQLVQLPPSNAKSYRIKNGTYSIINALQEKLDPNTLNCNEEIKSITATNSGINATSNTSSYQCKHIISTLPPLLLSKTIQITPALSKETQALLQNTHTWMQDSIRVGITYKTAFWKAERSSGTIYSSAGPIQEFYDHSNADNNLHALSGFIQSSYHEKTKAERKTLIIEQLQEYYGDQALDYDSYEECVWASEKQTTIASDHFLMPQTNNGHPLYQNSHLNDRLFIAGAETSPVFSGKMEGAITSALHVYRQLEAIYS